MRTIVCARLAAVLLGAICAWTAGVAQSQTLPVMEAVVGNNFGHLPMFVGAEKGLFKKHGVEIKLKVVNIFSNPRVCKAKIWM